MSGRPPTFDHLLSRKRPVTKTVIITLDPDLAEEHTAAKRHQEATAAKAANRPDDTEAHTELWEAEQRLADLEQRLADEDAVAFFTFRSIGRAAYDALVDEHQPTAAQRAEAKARGMGTIAWNPDTFPPALVALCLESVRLPGSEPEKLSEAQVRALWESDDWNQLELGELFTAAAEVNGTRRTVELGKDWPRTRSTGPSSTTAPSGVSPTPSS